MTDQVSEPVYKAVERILDEHSAWIARPSHEVTKAVALAATLAAHKIVDDTVRDLAALESGGASALLPIDSPIMKAWESFKTSESFANSWKWAAQEAHRDGSMWACFLTGWQAAHRTIGQQ